MSAADTWKEGTSVTDDAAARALLADAGVHLDVLADRKIVRVVTVNEQRHLAAVLHSPKGEALGVLLHPFATGVAVPVGIAPFPGVTMLNGTAHRLLTAKSEQPGEPRAVDTHVTAAGAIVATGLPRFASLAAEAAGSKRLFAVFGVPMGARQWSATLAAHIPDGTKLVLDVDGEVEADILRLLHGRDLKIGRRRKRGP